MSVESGFEDIHQFVAAQLHEDEAVAKSAAEKAAGAPVYGVPDLAGKWRATNDGVYADTAYGNSPFAIDGYGFLSDEIGEHIARHDPARVLLEVASRRRVLERHRRPRGPAEVPAGVSSECCVGCGFLGDDGIPARTPHIDLCPELRDLAAPYAGRPGYKPMWQPR